LGKVKHDSQLPKTFGRIGTNTRNVGTSYDSSRCAVSSQNAAPRFQANSLPDKRLSKLGWLSLIRYLTKITNRIARRSISLTVIKTFT
jgi:hypothetical protein